MGQAHLSDGANYFGAEICRSEKARDIVNAIAPTAVCVAVTAATGNPLLGKGAGQVVKVAKAVCPEGTAKFVSTVAAGVALDLATPVFAAAAVVGLGCMGVKKIGKWLDSL
jgi:hypothetical protein